MRGVNKRYKQKEIKKYLHTNKIDLAGLVKTRVKEYNMKSVVQARAPGWGLVHNYEATKNGIAWLI